jgi:AP-4 complex subunit epsilon-1
MSKFYSAETQQGHSSHFIQYIRKISEATSKQEEDQLVEEDLKELKVDLTSSTANDEQLLKEYAVRAYYAELLGHSAEFAYIHCINLSCHSKLLFKRTGYLATKLMVNPESELMYLIVSSIQRDLKSPNHLEVAAALTAAAQMLRPELMTVVQGDLPGLMTHEKPLVRRKVVEAMHAFYARSDTAIGDVVSFRQALCDRDPSVMDAATRLLHDVIQRSPDAHRDLLDSFVMILSQVIERRLPRTYDYHRTPAPWLQIRVIQLLTILIGNDPQRVQKAAHVLEEAMQRADNGKLIGFAIICELVRTAASIPPLPTLLSLAAEAVSGLITARNPSLRCAGIQALSYMVRVKPELAVEHQEVVMSCLEDADETIRRKSIWLLFAICDSDNIGPIARRLTRFLSKVSDPFLKRSTTRSLCRLMEQYATSPWWYIRTMNSVLAVAAECVLPTTIQRMLKLIAEGQGVDDEADTNFRTRCVETYFAITGGASPSSSSCSVDVAGGAAAGAALSSPGAHSVHDVRGAAGSSSSSSTSAIPEVLCRIGAWVMGEYGFLTSKISGDMLLDRLCDLMEQTEDGETRCWILMAIMKVTTQTQQRSTGAVIDYADDVAAQYQDSRCIPLQQRCYEFAALRKQPELLRRVLPKDGFCEAMDVDPELHFLDDFMKMAVARGAQRYAAPADVAALRQQHAAAASALHAESALRTAAYVPARSTDIHPVWSASLMGGGTDAGHATSASASSGVVVDSVAVPPNAGLAQSVLQGSERLILQPTATKRWGAQNLREMEAAEEEVHLQVAAAAAVGGGGIVWGADTVRDAPESPVAASFAAGNAAAASSSVGRGAGSAFKESAGDTASTGFGRGRDFTSAGKGKPVSAKNAKFVRSIFGSGRRKGGTKAPSALNAAPAAGATTATTTVLSKHSSPSPQLPASAPVSHKQQQQPFAQASKVMDSLFATDAASTHSSPLSATGEKKTDATMDWFSSSSGGPNVTSISVSRQGTTAAALAALQPPDPAFNTEQFGRTWQAIGISGGRRQRLHFADLSSYAAPDGFLQQYLLQSCSMRVVQIIGKELIAAAQCDAAGGKKAYVLAHLTVANATTLDVEVRAAHRELSEEVLRALKGL